MAAYNNAVVATMLVWIALMWYAEYIPMDPSHPIDKMDVQYDIRIGHNCTTWGNSKTACLDQFSSKVVNPLSKECPAQRTGRLLPLVLPLLVTAMGLGGVSLFGLAMAQKHSQDRFGIGRRKIDNKFQFDTIEHAVAETNHYCINSTIQKNLTNAINNFVKEIVTVVDNIPAIKFEFMKMTFQETQQNGQSLIIHGDDSKKHRMLKLANDLALIMKCANGDCSFGNVPKSWSLDMSSNILRISFVASIFQGLK